MGLRAVFIKGCHAAFLFQFAGNQAIFWIVITRKVEHINRLVVPCFISYLVTMGFGPSLFKRSGYI